MLNKAHPLLTAAVQSDQEIAMPSARRQVLRLALLIGLLACLWLVFDQVVLQAPLRYLWLELTFVALLILTAYQSQDREQKAESQLHQQLLTQALKNRLLFDEAPVAMLELQNGVMVQGNQAAFTLLGDIGHDDNLADRFIDTDHALVNDWLTAAALGMSSNILGQRVTLLNAEHRPATVELSMMRQDSWQNSILLVLYDVTEQAAQEALLRQSEQRLELALRGTRDAPWDWQLDSDLMYYSPRWWDMLGYAPDELQGDASLWRSLIHPDDAQQVQRHFNAVLKGTQQRYELSFRLRHKDGHYLPVLSRGFILRDGSGRAIRVSGTNSDQSSQAAFEQSLLADVRQLGAFVANLPGYVYRSKALQPAVPDYISPGVEQLTGYSQDDYLLRLYPYGMEIHPDDQDMVYATIHDALASQQSYEIEYRIYDRHGELKWVWERGRGIVSEQEQQQGREGFVTEITSRKKAEQALTESEYRWKFALEGAGDGVWDWHLPSGTMYYSPRWKALLGYLPDEIGDSPSEWECRLHPDEREAVQQAMGRHMTGQSPGYVCEHRLRCKNGDWKWVLERAMVVSRGSNGQAVRLIGSHSDITERKLMLQQLQHSESLLRRMGQIAKIGGWELCLHNMQLSWSEEACRIHDLPPEQKITLEQAIQFYLPEAREQLRACIARGMNSGQPWDLELPFVSASGKPRWARSQGDAIWENGRIVKLHGAVQDISERRQIKLALQQEKTRLNAILDSAVDAIIVVNQEGRIEQFNPAACRIFGYEAAQALGEQVTLLMPRTDWQEHAQKLQHALHSGNISIIGKGHELQGLRRNGEQFPVEVSISVWKEQEQRFFTAVVRDVTERRAVQAQLIQSQKMESLSMLSGGLAHDFNNLLGIITGNLDFLETRLEGDEKAMQRLQSALRATERGADITRRMLALSRQRSSHNISPQQVNHLISNIIKILEGMLGASYHLHADLAANAYDCDMDPAEFENVLLNLSINARDAMPDGGHISIRTRNIRHQELLAPSLAMLDASLDYLEISFADTGCGMSEEVLRHACEPFFSTKQAKGTGLGLAMVYTFAKDLKGHLHIDSRPGIGSTFYLYLQRSSQQAQPLPLSTARAELPGGQEWILVVDDETELLHSTSEHLQQLGYQVLSASNATEALQQLESNPQIALLLSDVVMPGGMFGTELASQARQRWPQLAVLLCSGFPQKIRDDPAYRAFADSLISKPFRKSELAQRVRATLDLMHDTSHPLHSGDTPATLTKV